MENIIFFMKILHITYIIVQFNLLSNNNYMHFLYYERLMKKVKIFSIASFSLNVMYYL